MANPSLTCTAVSSGSVPVVTVLIDQLRDAPVAYKLRDDIIAIVGEAKPAGIVIDLAKVTFVGSVGFLAFLGVRRHLSGGRIVLCNLSNPIRDMFSVCKLIATSENSTAPFETANTVAEAVSLLSA